MKHNKIIYIFFLFVQLGVDFFGCGGCSVLDTDCSILQLGGLYTFIACDL